MSSSKDNKFPIPKFYFKVTIDGVDAGFQEVTGLDVENEIVEYRDGSDPEFIPQRRVSIRKSGTVSFKKGMFKGDTQFRDLYKKIYDDKSKFFSSDNNNLNIIVELLTEKMDDVAFKWEIQNAVPIKLSTDSLNSTENSIAIETMEFSHSGIKFS